MVDPLNKIDYSVEIDVRYLKDIIKSISSEKPKQTELEYLYSRIKCEKPNVKDFIG